MHLRDYYADTVQTVVKCISNELERYRRVQKIIMEGYIDPEEFAPEGPLW